MIPANLLSLIIFLPLLGGLVVLAFRRHPNPCRWISLGTASMDLFLILSVYLLEIRVHPAGDWLIVEDTSWIETLGIRYSLGLDGISLLLIMLTSFLGIIVILVSWTQVTSRVALFHFFLLSMQTGVLGVFLATDLFLFYLFWELQVVPMFFIIGIWGHEKRIHAAVKFVLFSITGSLLMLAALIGIVVVHGSQTGHYSFSLFDLVGTSLSSNLENWFFAAFLLAFAVKTPLFPVHTWLPDAHTEAPTAGSVILAGLLLKTGTYAILRFAFPLFPSAAGVAVPVLMVLGLSGVFYASWIALAQKDMKRLVAYSSIGHMGLIIVGVAAWNAMTLSGSVLQMINHGLTTSALFILVGMLDERVNSRQLSDYGGIWRKMPVFSGFFLLFGMSSLGLPGLNNFVGEILILLGTFKVQPAAAVIGFMGMVLVLIYVLRLIQDALFGEPRTDWNVRDITAREALILVPFALLVILIGLYPHPFLDLVDGPVRNLVLETGTAMNTGAM